MSDYCGATCKKHGECACWGCHTCAEDRRKARGDYTPEERIAKLEAKIKKLSAKPKRRKAKA
jgi:hypothetical protein